MGKESWLLLGHMHEKGSSTRDTQSLEGRYCGKQIIIIWTIDCLAVQLMGSCLFYLPTVYLSIFLPSQLSFCLLCVSPLYLYTCISSISFLSSINIKHIYIQETFIEYLIILPCKIIISTYSPRHFFVFKYKEELSLRTHFRPHYACVSETVPPSLKLLGEITDHCGVM